MRSRPRLKGLLGLLGLCLALLPGPARTGHAQPRGQGGPGANAPPDTVQARRVFGFLVPTYTTSYSLNRGETAWKQTFAFSNDWRGLSLKNTTDYTIKTDPKRVNFKVRQGSTYNSLGYMLLDRLPLTGEFNYSRSGTTDTGRETTTNQLDSFVGTDYNFKTGRFRNSVKATVGLSNRTDSQFLIGDRLTTNNLGLTRKLSAGTYLIGPLRGMTLKLDGNLQLEGSNVKATEGQGILQGTVSVATNGGAVPKAFVEVFRAGSLEIVRSDSTGAVSVDGTARRYNFADMPPGRFDVRFSARGYETVTRTASVEIEQTTDLGDTPLTSGFHTAYARIELAGDLLTPSSEFDPSIRVPMTNVYGGVWQVEVRGTSAGDHRFKFLTGDSRGDFGSDQLTCSGDRSVGPVRLVTGEGGSICATFTGGGGFRITLNEEALQFRIERLKASEDGPKNNAVNSASMAVTYSPFDALTSDLSVNGNHNTDSYIVVSNDPTKKGRREQSTSNMTSVALNMTFRPPKDPTTEIALKASSNHSSFARLVEVDRASERSGTQFDLRARRKILRNQVTLHYEQARDRDEPRTRASSTTLTRVMDGALERIVSPRLTTRMIGELRLRRQNYDDTIQDSDGLRSKVEAGLVYRPDSSMTGTLTGTRTLDDLRNINSTLSQNSRYEERYGVAFGVEWQISLRTRLTQKYNYQPAFTTNRFNKASDRLDRSRDVSTTLTTQLNPRLNLQLRHYYKLVESGGYRRAPDGTRLFAVGENKYTQDLTTSVSWKPLAWLNFSTDERYYRYDNLAVPTDQRTISSRLDFTQRGSFQRPLPGGGLIQMDVSYFVQASLRPQRGRREHYLSANIELNKTF